MKRLAVVFLLNLSLLSLQASAANPTPFTRAFDAVPVKPAVGANSGIAQEGAALPPGGSIHAALLLDYVNGVMALKLGDDKLGNLIPYRLDAHVMFAYQIHRRLELGASIPVTLTQGDNFGLLTAQGFNQTGVSSFGLGDIRFVPRFMILDPTTLPIGLAVIAEIRANTGAAENFLGARSVSVLPRVAVEVPLGDLRILANAGYRFREAGQFLNLYVGNEFQASAGGIYNFGDVGKLRRFEALAEMHLATPTGAPFTFAQADSLKTPWEVLVGARTKFSNRWGVELSVGRGVTGESGYGREAFRVLGGLRYDFQSADKDGDGISDSEDVCVDIPEDRDGFQDSDGCPDPDNDADGLKDGEDRCPLEAGTKELDGCPDRDGDDIPDVLDKCPDEMGPPENEGCPNEEAQVEVESDRIRVKGNIQYATNSAEISPASFPLLDEVASVLNKNPKLGPVLIEGHTDNRGSRAHNLDLSQRRANSVLEYLVKKGVERKRLSAKGYGFDKPVASNNDALGRAKNRRTEFRLVTAEDAKPQNPAEGEDQVKPKVQDAALKK